MESTITLGEIQEYLNEFLLTPEGFNAAVSKGHGRFSANFANFVCKKKNTEKFPQMIDCTSDDIDKLIDEVLTKSNM